MVTIIKLRPRTEASEARDGEVRQCELTPYEFVEFSVPSDWPLFDVEIEKPIARAA